MSKTPFEIRLELLTLAKDILSEKVYSERNRLEQDWFAKREVCVENREPVPPFPKTTPINESEIVELAAKLNDFVSNG